MNTPKKIIRCAIYTRKSVEEGLDMEFNTLDAQRMVAENYIASQQFNGWVCLPQHYDDGGFSGGTLERPAIQQLLKDAQARLVDLIIVYKIDRLSRSITDFADLSRKLDEWGVSLVSVTQDINTSTSSGRMMLNILMTFAQYEREIIAERIRDKLSSSRKRGLWTGGPVPYGYVVKDKKLIVEPTQAKVVRWMFKRYLEIHSPLAIAIELESRGIFPPKSKKWNDTRINGILKNKLYTGQIHCTTDNKWYNAVHDAIVPTDCFNQVQKAIQKEVPYVNENRYTITAFLRGVLTCGLCGKRLHANFACKYKNHRYYYYVCDSHAEGHRHFGALRLPAGDLEALVVDRVLVLLTSDEFATALSISKGISKQIISKTLNQMPRYWDLLYPLEKTRIINLLIEEIVISEEKLDIVFKINGMDSLVKEMLNGNNITAQ